MKKIASPSSPGAEYKTLEKNTLLLQKLLAKSTINHGFIDFMESFIVRKRTARDSFIQSQARSL